MYVEVGKTTTKVHKEILGTRSSVFYKILRSTPENSQINTIEIKNFRVEVAKKMLRYIYTDDISGIERIDGKMLAIAIEYGLDRLKKVAAKCLCNDLTVENVCERHILSEKFSSEELGECCQKFIFDNAENLRKTKNLKELFKNHPSLSKGLFWELFGLFSTSNNSSSEEESQT